MRFAGRAGKAGPGQDPCPGPHPSAPPYPAKARRSRATASMTLPHSPGCDWR